jgi:hypothetical protein
LLLSPEITDLRNPSNKQSGNALLIVLTAIILVGMLTVAIQGTSRPQDSGIDREQLVLNMSKVRQYAMELEHAVNLIMQDGFSESDIRFAHLDAPADYGDLSADGDPSDQVFHYDGGAATYRQPPGGIQTTAANWEFYGSTSLPDVGTGKPELVAVLPNVTLEFCEKVNEVNGYNSSTQPLDTGVASATATDAGSCIYGEEAARFDDGVQFYDPPSKTSNTVDEATFTEKPSLQGCVKCARDSKYHFFHVLLRR